MTDPDQPVAIGPDLGPLSARQDRRKTSIVAFNIRKGLESGPS